MNRLPLLLALSLSSAVVAGVCAPAWAQTTPPAVRACISGFCGGDTTLCDESACWDAGDSKFADRPGKPRSCFTRDELQFFKERSLFWQNTSQMWIHRGKGGIVSEEEQLIADLEETLSEVSRECAP